MKGLDEDEPMTGVGGKLTLGGEEPGVGSDARGVKGEGEGEIWGEAGRELCFIADLRTTTGGGRSFTKETGSVLEPNIVNGGEQSNLVVRRRRRSSCRRCRRRSASGSELR
jgi:hypothetical protein